MKMTGLAAERIQENAIADTDEIKKLRELYQRENKMAYADGGVESLAFTLSGVCGQNIYVGKEAAVYFEILDTRDFLKEKYAELSDFEMIKHKEDVESTLAEAEDMLKFLGKYVS